MPDQSFVRPESKQKDLLASFQIQSLVLQRMDEGVSVSDENGFIILTNPAEDKMFGYEEGELIGKHVTVQNAYSPEENEKIVEGVIDELKTKGFWSGEWHNRKKDGIEFYTHSYITASVVDGKTMFVCVQRDITEEKKYRDALIESEDYFRTLADSIPQLAWMTDAEGWIYWYNKRWYDYTGTTLEEMQGWGWQTVHHPDLVEGVISRFKKSVETKTPWEDTFLLRGKDGQFRWFLSRAVPIRNDKGEVIKWLGTNTDISEQRETEQALKEAKEQLEITFRNVPSAIYHFDKTGKILYLNEKGAKLLGYETVEEVLAETDVYQLRKKLDETFEVLDEWGKPLPVDKSSAAIAFKTGKASEVVGQFIKKKTGSSFWLLSKSAPLYDDKGELFMVLNTSTDITQQKTAEEIIRQSEKRYSSLAQATSSVVWLTDADGAFIAPQFSWEAYTGQPWEEHKGFGWAATLHEADRERIVQAWQESLPQKMLFEAQARIWSKVHNSYRHFEVRAVPITDTNGVVLEWVGMITDIHEKRIAEEELKRFKFMADNASDPFILMKEDGSFAYLNDLALERWGYTRKEAEHLRVPDVDPIYNFELFNKVFALAQKEKIPQFETLHKRKEGTIYPVEVNMGGLTLEGQPYLFAVARDITERTQAEKALKESEESFRSLADQSPMIVYIVEPDAEATVNYFNKTWLDYTGQNFEEAIGRAWDGIVHPDDVQPVLDIYVPAFQNRISYTLPAIRLRRHDGEYRYHIFKGNPRFLPSGEFMGFVGVGFDINEQKTAEQAIQYRKALLEAHNEATEDGILLVDAKGKILSFNKRFIEIWNMPADIVAAQDDNAALSFAMSQLVYPQQFIDKVKYLYDHPTETSLDELLFKDGKIIERQGYPVISTDGSYYAWSWNFRDVTERKRIQKELQASEMLFKTISNASPITLWLSDENGGIVYVNETWVEWTGLSLQASLSQGWIEAIIEEDREKAGSQFLADLGARRYYLIEFRIRRKDGQVRWCLSEGKPYYNVEGNFAGYAGSCSDITERKSIEDELEIRVQLRTEELQVSNKKLETSNQELEQYAYVASHDLQEPLRKIRTYSGLLINETKNSLNAAAVERLEKITSSAERMSNLITDLLSFSRLLKPDQLFAPTDLNEVLQNILTDFELTIQQKNALVKIEQLPVIEAMPLQMNQLFYNLINNALKFSKENETPLIIIKSRLLTNDEMMENKILKPQLSYHIISISDNGIGFNQQFADQIFEVFKRLHTKQAYPGSGIGLALCKKIALNHQGYIFAEAKEGLGATFHVLLPAAQFLN